MRESKVTLTATDLRAIDLQDSNYINNKGAKYYSNEAYKDAVEYYRLASAMGNVHATSNLGYCYLYGRDIEQNVSLAIAYFKISAIQEDLDSIYKLGDIYGSDKWGVKDKELSVYYYNLAAGLLIDSGWYAMKNITRYIRLLDYPSLCYALGREMSNGGEMITDLQLAYQFLKFAQFGYKREIDNGSVMYQKSYEGATKLINDSQFDSVREFCEGLFYEDEIEELS